jgi:hypothetical protein
MKHKHRAVGLRQAEARSRGLVLRMYDLAYTLVGFSSKAPAFELFYKTY